MVLDCGGDVFVGDLHACDTGGFDRTIHLWRGRDCSPGATCAHVLAGQTEELVIHWREEEFLTQMSVPVQDVIEYARLPGRLLVHCRGGHCRSANLAVLVGVARGLDPFAVMDRLNRARFAQAGGIPAWKWPDLNWIIRLAAEGIAR